MTEGMGRQGVKKGQKGGEGAYDDDNDSCSNSLCTRPFTKLEAAVVSVRTMGANPPLTPVGGGAGNRGIGRKPPRRRGKKGKNNRLFFPVLSELTSVVKDFKTNKTNKTRRRGSRGA